MYIGRNEILHNASQFFVNKTFLCISLLMKKCAVGGNRMSFGDNGIDITKNIKIIEWLKSELLSSFASLFELLVKGIKGQKEAIADILANIILVTYVLARRLGISYSNLDMRIDDKIKLGVLEDHKIESWFGDLSALKKHMDKNSKE